MDRMVEKFFSAAEADKATKNYYLSLTPEQRLDILLELIARARNQSDESSQRLREFIESLNSHRVEYVIVDAYALAFHGRPRYTGDIDVLVRTSPENAARLKSVIADFRFVSLGLSADDFLLSGQIIQLGQPPNRIDILTSITGLTFDEVWESRVPSRLDGLPVWFISKDFLIKNKKPTGRNQDKADLEALGADEPADP